MLHIPTTSGIEFQNSKHVFKDFQTLYKDNLFHSTCLYTDESKKSKEKTFSGFSIISLDNSITHSVCSIGFLSTYCVEVMANLEALVLCLEFK